jgi:hypothetical protein
MTTDRKSRRPGTPPAWSVTLTDLGFLVLAFFVVQVATAAPRPAAWLDIAASLSRQLVPGEDASRTGPTAEANVPLRAETFGLDTGYLVTLAEETVMPALEPLGAMLRIERRGLAIELPLGPFGPSGGWTGVPARDALAALGQAFRFVDNAIAIVAITEAGAFEAGLEEADAIAAVLREGGYEPPLKVLAAVGDGARTGLYTDGVLAIEIRVQDTEDATD